MIITAVEAPGFSLDRLVAAADARGVRTRMVTRDADVRSPDQDALAGEDLVVTLVNTADLPPSQDPDSWAASALTAAIGLALDHQNPEARTLTANRAALRSHLYQHGLTCGPGRVFGPGTSDKDILRTVTFPTVIRDSAGLADRDGWLARTLADLHTIRRAAAIGEMLGDTFTAEPYFAGPAFDVEVLTWAGQTWIRSVTARAGALDPDAAFPPHRMPELNRWLTRVLRRVGVHRGFARVEVVITEPRFEAVTIDIRSGGGSHGEDLCRVLGMGALAVFADVMFDDRPAPVRANANRALFYAGDVAAPGAPPLTARDPSEIDGASHRSPSDPFSTSGAPGCVAVLLASGPAAESTLLTAMASAASRRRSHCGGAVLAA